MRRIIYVEDTYGEGFHRKILEKLKKVGLVASSLNPRVERLPAGKCNTALRRKVLAKAAAASGAALKVVFVVDSEGNPEAPYSAVLRHFEEAPLVVSAKVVSVDPRHEAWLCIGLGGDRRGCRVSPEEVLSRLRRTRYESKRYLEEWANGIEVRYLLNEPDFRSYLECLGWLSEDP